MAYAPLMGWATWGLPALAVGLFLGGVAMLVRGRRGRRIDDHPVCRRCRFDLSGTEMPEDQPPKCPECGWRRVPRTGNRKPSPVMAWLGAAAIAAGLLGGGVLGWEALDGKHQVDHKPVWLLRWQVRVSTPETAVEVIDELIRRQRSGRLSAEESKQLVADAVAYGPAGDEGLTHTYLGARWDQLAVELVRAGHADSSQREALARSWTGLKVSVRPQVRRGQALPLNIGRFVFGPSVSQPFSVEHGETRVRIGDVELKANSGFRGRLEGPRWGAGTNSAEFLIRFPPDHSEGMIPGDHLVLIECPLRIVDLSTGQPIAEWTHSQSLAFEVVAPDADPIRLIRDPSLGAEIQGRTKVSALMVSGDRMELSAGLEIDGVDVPLAYRVYLRQGRQRWFFDDLTIEPLATDGLTTTLRGEMPAELSERSSVDIEFVPAPDLARQTVGLTEILDHGFVIEKVYVWGEHSGVVVPYFPSDR